MPEPQTDWTETFARARGADIEAVAGTPLFRSGQRLRGECPLCGASKGKRADGAFSVEPRAGWFKCWGCGEGGDVIELEYQLRGGSLREAAVRLAGMAVSVPGGRTAAASRPPSPSGGATSGAARVALDIWEGRRRSAFGLSPAGRYLVGRGLDLRQHDALNRLHYNPHAIWGWVDHERVDAPAMVARVETPSGPTGGLHVTYLKADGSTKARLDPAKRMWGPQRDAEGRPGGVWLSAIDGPGPLIVGEGIESTLSAMQLCGRPCRGVAALSLGALQGGWVLDRFGRLDPVAPAADPERPAFTWPDQDEVLIAVDRDMKPVRVKVRKLGGGTVQRVLESEDRARICAGLAVQAWRAAGANAVRVIAPGAGRDFNDELMARVGA